MAKAIHADRWPLRAAQAALTAQPVAKALMITAPTGPTPESCGPPNNITAKKSKPAVANTISAIRRGGNADISQPVRSEHQTPGKRRSPADTLKYAERCRSNSTSAPEFRNFGLNS
jgi:hypothetical protein